MRVRRNVALPHLRSSALMLSLPSCANFLITTLRFLNFALPTAFPSCGYAWAVTAALNLCLTATLPRFTPFFVLGRGHVAACGGRRHSSTISVLRRLGPWCGPVSMALWPGYACPFLPTAVHCGIVLPSCVCTVHSFCQCLVQ